MHVFSLHRFAQYLSCNAVNPCDSMPCLNDGTCTLNGGPGYFCTCPPGFIGVNCESTGM